MEINDIEHKISCNEMSAAQVFTQMKQHIKNGQAGDDKDLTKGVWFQSWASGLWYKSPEAAGSVRVVLVNGKSYFRDGA